MALKEIGKYVQDCECGLMLGKSDFKNGNGYCPRCGKTCRAHDAAPSVAEKIEGDTGDGKEE